MTFEWDSAKASANLRKHKVSFTEAASVFLDPLALTFDDPDHSGEENREITIGISNKERTLFVSHCLRSERLRIISARRATKREKIQYGETIG
ncbi:MAG: hypothetical protein NPIRA02_35180 [Nitrospirales bacterium]|nr:MAG: hypothetical protein NPIRA02_35180 [Nitrospirales bacterium]